MSEIDILSFGETMAMFVAEQAGDLSSVSAFHKRIAGSDTIVPLAFARPGLTRALFRRGGPGPGRAGNAGVRGSVRTVRSRSACCTSGTGVTSSRSGGTP